MAEIEMRLHAVNAEPLHARVEIHQADRHAANALDRQSRLVRRVADQLALLDVQVEGVGLNVDRVKPDPLGLHDPEFGTLARLRPGGCDDAKFPRFSSMEFASSNL